MTYNSNTSVILLGMAIGDALGMPFETQKPFSNMLNEWDGKTYLDSNMTYHKLTAGSITDDTGMALALARSLIKNGFYDPKTTMEEYSNWIKESPAGAGGTIKKALENYQAGNEWFLSGVHLEKNVAGNGPAMRIAPLSLFYAKRHLNTYIPWSVTVERLAKDVYFDSILTHKHPSDLTFEATYFFANILMNSITNNGENLNSNFFVNKFNFKNKELTDVMLNFHEKDVLTDLNNFDEKTEEMILNQLIKYNDFGIVSTVCAAIFCAKKYKDNFGKALEVIIRSGGDTDTRAALVGALVASRVSLDGIPKELIFGLKNYHEIISTETLLVNTARNKKESI